MSEAEILIACTVPLISGIVAIVCALITSNAQKQIGNKQIMSSMRFKAYLTLEELHAKWSADPTTINTAAFADACIGVMLVSSKETAKKANEFKNKMFDYLSDQQTARSEDLAKVYGELIRLMQADLQIEDPSRKQR